MPVCTTPAAVVIDSPMPTASDELNESISMSCGACSSSACFVSWLHITPDEEIIVSDDRS